MLNYLTLYFSSKFIVFNCFISTIWVYNIESRALDEFEKILIDLENINTNKTSPYIKSKKLEKCIRFRKVQRKKGNIESDFNILDLIIKY